MKQTLETIRDILSEDFEVPVYNADLQNIIEEAFIEYENKPLFRKEKRMFKIKLNELIEIYNDRRNMVIYSNVR